MNQTQMQQNELMQLKATKITEELIDSVEGLKEVLDQETELLKIGKVKEALRLETYKNDISSNYVRLVHIANENKANILPKGTEGHNALEKSLEGLADSLERNMLVLQNVRDISNELIESTANYVNSKIGGASTYTNKGNMKISHAKATKSVAMFKEI